MPASPPAAAPARLFVALWPDDALRAAIDEQRARWRWPREAAPARTDRLHLTLHFLGDVAADRIGGLREALRAVPVEAFDLRLDGAAVWPNGIALLRPTSVELTLGRLYAAVGDALRAQGFETEDRPYRPHLTLARHAQHAVPPSDPFVLTWHVRDFVLVESEKRPPARYAVVERYAA